MKKKYMLQKKSFCREEFNETLNLQNMSLNPLTPMSDQDRISPYNTDTISTR